MYNRYIPNGMAYTRVVEEDAPPFLHPGAQQHPGQGQGSRFQGQRPNGGFPPQNSGGQGVQGQRPTHQEPAGQGSHTGPFGFLGGEARTEGGFEQVPFQEQTHQNGNSQDQDFSFQSGGTAPPPQPGEKGEAPSPEKKPSWLSSLLKGFKLEELDTGDILLLLILLFLFLDGESDNIEILVVLGLVILFGLGGKKDKDKEKNQPPA